MIQTTPLIWRDLSQFHDVPPPIGPLYGAPTKIIVLYLHVNKKLDVQQIFCLTSSAANFSI